MYRRRYPQFWHSGSESRTRLALFVIVKAMHDGNMRPKFGRRTAIANSLIQARSGDFCVGSMRCAGPALTGRALSSTVPRHGWCRRRCFCQEQACLNGRLRACAAVRIVASGACWRHGLRQTRSNGSKPFWWSRRLRGGARWTGYDQGRRCKARPNLPGRSSVSTKYGNSSPGYPAPINYRRPAFWLSHDLPVPPRRRRSLECRTSVARLRYSLSFG